MRVYRKLCWGLFLLFSLQIARATADDRSAADLLPETTILYAEISQPSRVLREVQEHPFRPRIESLKGIRQALESDRYLRFNAVVSVMEAKLGQTWPQVFSAAADCGIALAIDGPTGGLGVLIQAQDEETLPRILSMLVDLARADAGGSGETDPVRSGRYRGITAYQLQDARVAAFGSWLLVTNKPDLGKAVIDSYLDKPENSLATNERFSIARSGPPGDTAVWAYLDVKGLRETGIAKDLFTGEAGNPLAEVIAGGLLDTLQHTTHVAATFALDAKHARLELTTPHKSEWVSEAREYFFGPDGNGVAPALLTVANELLSLSTYRDISTMWLHAGDLFDEETSAGLAQTDANLSTLFSGKDFGHEVLGAVEPEVQLVVARQTLAHDEPQPAIKIPAFALAFRLKDPTIKPDFRRTFQSLIGFINVVGAMNGQPQLDLDLENDGDRQIVSASYLVDKEEAGRAGLKIHYNFSPSVAFVGDRFIVSSTKRLAGELSELLAQDLPKTSSVNTAVRTNLNGVREILADNRGQLVAQNMLNEGNTKAEAESEIDNLLQLIAGVRQSSLEMNVSKSAIRVVFDLSFSDGSRDER